jgi:hypothetical protein
MLSVNGLVQTFNNPTPESGDQFGSSVAIDGNTALVGARRDNTPHTWAGSVYLFEANSGALLRTIQNPDPINPTSEEFGNSVAISGNSVLVGAHFYRSDVAGGVSQEGIAYLFDATTGGLLQTFNNPTPEGGDQFGSSVAISGNHVLVGARNDSTSAERAGTAYLFDATTGGLLLTLNNPTPAFGDAFGSSVAISGSNVLVGAERDDSGAPNSGSVYLFDATTGSLLRTINNPTPQSGDVFGKSVAISANSVVVGAIGDNTGAFDAGSAYLFDAVSGTLLNTFENPTPELGDFFGSSVSISGNNVLIGAAGVNSGVDNSGAAYLFDAATGNLLDAFTNPTPAESDGFGKSVAISGTNVLVGAEGDDNWSANAGSAYLFDATPVAPTAEAGGPYLTQVGLVELDASGTSDPNQDSSTLLYEWDLDGDGQFGETGAAASHGDETGINPTYSAAGLQGATPVTVTLKVTDNSGLSDTDTATIEFPQSVTIDIKPGSDPNSINVASNGQISVAVFTTDDFDATKIDASTVVFAGAYAVQSVLEDVDGDGDLDMVLHFLTQDTMLAEVYAQLLADDLNGDGVLDSTNQEAEASLTGETVDYVFFEGSDEVNLMLRGRALRELLEDLFI